MNKEFNEIIGFEDEEWKMIRGYGKRYAISSYGRVYSFEKLVKGRLWKGSFMTNSLGSSGYSHVSLRKDGKAKIETVHRLVAQCFCEKPEHATQVNHIDGDKTNNHYTNLEWVSASENMKHYYANNKRGSKLSDVTIADIERLYEWGVSKAEIARKLDIEYRSVLHYLPAS